MSTDTKKPWTMDEMIANSGHWTLACDSALLTSLKSFADNLLTKSREIDANLSNLTRQLDNTGLELHLAQNRFQSLKNTQFIESRVYEDDETVQEPSQESKVVSHDEVDHSESIRLAALKGLEVLDKYFDRVEVSVSDSEDDDTNLPSYILRPKDLYLERPLPHVIGSQEWYKGTKVGLESSSDSESDKLSDFSETDEEESRINGEKSPIKEFSSSESELEFNKSDDDSMSNDNNAPNNFPEELAKKLGNVIDDVPPTTVNTRPINNNPARHQYGDPFFDEEPPPLEQNALFSPTTGLFDDDDDDNQAGFDSPTESSKGLFDGDDFNANVAPKKTILTESNVPKPPMIHDEPPPPPPSELSGGNGKGKPIGGVSIFGGGKLFDKQFLKRQQSSSADDEDDDSIVKHVKNTETSAPSITSSQTKEDLFAQEFDDEPSVNNVTTEQKSSLFDENDDLFKNSDLLFASPSSEPRKNLTSLFDDDHDITSQNKGISPVLDHSKSDSKDHRTFPNSYDDLFGSSPETTDDLFADVTPVIFKVNTGGGGGLFADDDFATPSDGTRAKFDIFGNSPPPADDLFASPEHPGGDIFAQLSKVTGVVNSVSTTTPSETDVQHQKMDETRKEDKNVEINRIESGKSKERRNTVDRNEETRSITEIHEESRNTTETKEETRSTSGINEDIAKIPEMSRKVPNVSRVQPNSDEPKEKPPEITEENRKKPEVTKRTKPVKPSRARTSPEQTERVRSSPEITEPARKQPGKLKINVAINVAALLPNSQVKIADIHATNTDDSTNDRHVEENVTKAVKTSEKDAVSNPAKSTVSDDKVEVLHSVTKDRAKVRALNRRPSTRKGRQAALKQSQVATDKSGDFYDSGNTVGDTESTPKVAQQKQDLGMFGDVTEAAKVSKSDVFGTKTSSSLLFEDTGFPTSFGDTPEVTKSSNVTGLFNDEETKTLEDSTKNVTNIQKVTRLFDDDDLKLPEVGNTQSLGLFDDSVQDLLFSDDIESDIFSSKAPEKEVKSLSKEQKSPETPEKLLEKEQKLLEKEQKSLEQKEKFKTLSKGLFSDVHDTDIFSTKSPVEKKQESLDKGQKSLDHGKKSLEIMKTSSEKNQQSLDLGNKFLEKKQKLPEKEQTSQKTETVAPIVEKKIPKSSILFEDEEDDDMFSKASVLPTKSKQKKSLFDDEDEDDDIFKIIPTTSKRTEVRQATERKVPKVGVKKMEKSQQVDDDPLSKLN